MAQQFSTIASVQNVGYDTALVLRDITDAAETATASETPIAFNAAANQSFKVRGSYNAYTSHTAGSAEWTISVQVDTAVGMASAVEVGDPVVLDAGPGSFEIALTGKQIEDLEPGATHIQVVATKTGSPDGLEYAAWIVPC